MPRPSRVRLMSRPIAGLGLAVGLVAALVAGCGSTPDEPDAGAGAGGATQNGDTETDAFPVTIDHKYGSTTMTDAPERVVTVGLTEQDAVLALGVVPVATTNWFGDDPGRIFPWAQDLLGDADVPVVLDSEQEFEQVASLKPDLILALYSSITTQDYELLSTIAPTIAQPEAYVDYGVPWQEATETIGAALGKADEAKALVDGVDDKIAALREEHPEFEGQEAAVATIYEGIFIYGPEDPRGRLLTDLGFTFPASLADVGNIEFGTSISVENADKVDVDALIWINSEDLVTKDVPTYGNLRVSREGRDIYIAEDDPLYDATSFQTVLSIPFLLDGIIPKLVAAVDGDTATATS
jgi:iron complex transport system substrate-binding protein